MLVRLFYFLIPVFLLPLDVDHKQRVRSHQLLLTNSVAVRRRVCGRHAVAAIHQARYTAPYQSKLDHTLRVSHRDRLLSHHPSHHQTKRHRDWSCDNVIWCTGLLRVREVAKQAESLRRVLGWCSQVPAEVVLVYLRRVAGEDVELND